MNDVTLSDLKTIENPKGNIYHALKRSDSSFINFGEAYFSSINFNEIKGWKKHTRMNLNLVVINGEVRFVVYNELTMKFSEYKLSRNNYKRLTVPPGFWVAFQGLSLNENLLLNIADIEHDPRESMNKDLGEIKYEW